MKNVIITGANKGIGKECVREFVAHGYNVWAFSRTEDETASKDFNELARRYNTIINEKYFDITNESECKNAIKQIARESTSIDVLVNNAGITAASSFLMTSIQKMKDMFEVNYFAPIILSQQVARCMMKTGGGTIVNVGSVTGIKPLDGAISYGSSKAALVYATQVMAKELGQYKIRVNAVCPGFVDTAMWKDRDEKSINISMEKSALGRQGKPEEIAKTIYYLASDDSSYITGSILVADGGMRIV